MNLEVKNEKTNVKKNPQINVNVSQSGFSLYSVNEGLKEQFSIISRVCTCVGKKQHRTTSRI